MIAATKALAVTCWLAALIAVLAAATQHQTVMGLSGLVGACAAMGWGLCRMLADEPDDVPHSFAESWDSAAVAMEDEDELPYRPIVRGVWPSDVGGFE